MMDYEAFREEVRDFLAVEYTPEMRARNARQTGMFAEPEVGMWWHCKLYQRGWIAPAWPKEYGGTGWDAVQKHIFESECSAASAPAIALMGLALAGPAIMKFGTPAQKDFFLPGILSGEIYFCQGFSEPGSGSDLASLRTKAVRDGDDYVVNGSKIWTTHAHHANWIFLLARTDHDVKPQAGISFLLAPINTPGITIRPIISISGTHDLNQVFFDNARVPVGNRVGAENQGWEVTKYLLEFERGGVSYAAGAFDSLAQAKKIARQQPGDDGGTLWQDIGFRRRAAELEIDLIALSATEQRVISSVAAGENVGDVIASILKISGTAAQQNATELAVEALGDYAFADQRACFPATSNEPPVGPDYAAKPVAKYLNTRAATIYGGSSEINHNVLARAALGLK